MNPKTVSVKAGAAQTLRKIRGGSVVQNLRYWPNVTERKRPSMPAKNKRDLLLVTEREFAKLGTLLESVAASVATKKRQEDISIKDIVAHRGHWIQLFLGWYRDGMAGKEVFFPAKGFKWNQLKLYNAELRQRQAKLTWSAARKLLQRNHAKLLAFIEEHSDKELYGGPMKGARNDWTAGRWVEAAGASHYRSASKFVRQCLKAA